MKEDLHYMELQITNLLIKPKKLCDKLKFKVIIIKNAKLSYLFL